MAWSRGHLEGQGIVVRIGCDQLDRELAVFQQGEGGGLHDRRVVPRVDLEGDRGQVSLDLSVGGSVGERVVAVIALEGTVLPFAEAYRLQLAMLGWADQVI